MEYLYKTVLKRARTEITIEKSRFITTIIPCETREEAESFFSDIRLEFKDATHNVPAFVLGNKMELKWASDDGEPQGTSGPPILKVMESKGLTNLALVVTRYFGGTKLGTGGLVRAYSKSAEQAIFEAGIAGAAVFRKEMIHLDYSDYNKFLSYKFPQEMRDSMILGTPDFREDVALEISCHKDILENVSGIIRDISNGKTVMGKGQEILTRFALTMEQ